MSVVGICDFPPIEMHDGWGSLKEVVVEGKGGPAPDEEPGPVLVNEQQPARLKWRGVPVA
jgi:hypothetical protein